MTLNDFDKLILHKKFISFSFKKNKHCVSRRAFVKTIFDKTYNQSFDFKFKEYIKFQKGTINQCDNEAVCIGYNPAKASLSLDVTNKRLIDLLWNNFSGYLLINLYPQVSTNKCSCIPDLDENKNFSEVIVEILKKDKREIIIFWGRSVLIDENIKDAIENRIQLNLPLKRTTHNGKFTHPASNADIKLEDVTLDRIRNSFHIE